MPLQKNRRVRLRGLGPVEREQIATWIESKYAHTPETIAKLEMWLRDHPDDRRAAGELLNWRASLAVARQLAHLARTELS